MLLVSGNPESTREVILLIKNLSIFLTYVHIFFFLTFEIFEKQNHQMWQKKEYIFRNEYKIPA